MTPNTIQHFVKLLSALTTPLERSIPHYVDKLSAEKAQEQVERATALVQIIDFVIKRIQKYTTINNYNSFLAQQDIVNTLKEIHAVVNNLEIIPEEFSTALTTIDDFVKNEIPEIREDEIQKITGLANNVIARSNLSPDNTATIINLLLQAYFYIKQLNAILEKREFGDQFSYEGNNSFLSALASTKNLLERLEQNFFDFQENNLIKRYFKEAIGKEISEEGMAIFKAGILQDKNEQQMQEFLLQIFPENAEEYLEDFKHDVKEIQEKLIENWITVHGDIWGAVASGFDLAHTIWNFFKGRDLVKNSAETTYPVIREMSENLVSLRKQIAPASDNINSNTSAWKEKIQEINHALPDLEKSHIALERAVHAVDMEGLFATVDQEGKVHSTAVRKNKTNEISLIKKQADQYKRVIDISKETRSNLRDVLNLTIALRFISIKLHGARAGQVVLQELKGINFQDIVFSNNSSSLVANDANRLFFSGKDDGKIVKKLEKIKRHLLEPDEKDAAEKLHLYRQIDELQREKELLVETVTGQVAELDKLTKKLPSTTAYVEKYAINMPVISEAHAASHGESTLSGSASSPLPKGSITINTPASSASITLNRSSTFSKAMSRMQTNPAAPSRGTLVGYTDAKNLLSILTIFEKQQYVTFKELTFAASKNVVFEYKPGDKVVHFSSTDANTIVTKLKALKDFSNNPLDAGLLKASMTEALELRKIMLALDPDVERLNKPAAAPGVSSSSSLSNTLKRAFTLKKPG